MVGKNVCIDEFHRSHSSKSVVLDVRGRERNQQERWEMWEGEEGSRDRDSGTERHTTIIMDVVKPSGVLVIMMIIPCKHLGDSMYVNLF